MQGGSARAAHVATAKMWRPTRQWCFTCGSRSLHAALTPLTSRYSVVNCCAVAPAALDVSLHHTGLKLPD